MSSTATRKLEGFAQIGGEVPWINPHKILIVGLDVKETADNWYAFCPRAREDLEPEWVDDIRENGVRQPVDCYRKDSTVIMLEGRRRVRAARIVWDEQKKAGVPEADRISVRVNVRKGDPAYLFSFNVGSESRKQRSPMQRAQMIVHAQKFGASDDAAAKMFSCTVATIKNMLSLFDLTSSVQKAVDAGTIPIHVAIKVAKMKQEDQEEAIGELVSAGATKGAAAVNGINKIKRGKAVSGADKSRVLPKAVLDGAADLLDEAKGYGEMVEMIRFITGRTSMPKGFSIEVQEAFVAAGYKAKKEKVVKQPKVPKEKKSKKEKPEKSA